jgi:GNAT superfamily N-acetyltransferase
MARSGGAETPEDPEKSLLAQLRESGDALEAAAPPFDGAAAAVRLHSAGKTRGFLQSGGSAIDWLAISGIEVEEAAPPFDVDAGAAMLRQSAQAGGLLSSEARGQRDRTADSSKLLRTSGKYPFALRLGMPSDLAAVSGLVQEAAEWMRTSKHTDQWASPWPDRFRQYERMLNDLLKGKTWLVWDSDAVAATITVDTNEPVDLNEQPVWPEHERHRSALYVRRVIVGRRYAGLGLGTALLDWAADMAKRDHNAAVIRIDLWTTNTDLHAYYETQGFVRRQGRHPQELANYPSQALFEREVDQSGSKYTEFFESLSAQKCHKGKAYGPGIKP